VPSPAERLRTQAHPGVVSAVVAEAIGLTAADVESALAYWADFPAEIDDLISGHRAGQDEALAAWECRRAPDDA